MLVAAFLLQTVLVYSDERTDPLDETALRGRALWHQHGCQVCHQIYGQGGFLGPDLTNVHSRIDSVRLRTLLTVGSGQMPAFRFTDQEIADVRAFLKSMDRPDLGRGQLRLGKSEDGDPWQRFDEVVRPMLMRDEAAAIRRGWEAFRGRPCAACHQPLVASPTGAPDLSRAADRLSDDELRQVLESGRLTKGMPPPAPAFSADELSDLIAFLEWLSTERAAIEQRWETSGPDRSVNWQTVPWWEYR